MIFVYNLNSTNLNLNFLCIYISQLIYIHHYTQNKLCSKYVNILSLIVCFTLLCLTIFI